MTAGYSGGGEGFGGGGGRGVDVDAAEVGDDMLELAETVGAGVIYSLSLAGRRRGSTELFHSRDLEIQEEYKSVKLGKVY